METGPAETFLLPTVAVTKSVARRALPPNVRVAEKTWGAGTPPKVCFDALKEEALLPELLADSAVRVSNVVVSTMAPVGPSTRHRISKDCPKRMRDGRSTKFTCGAADDGAGAGVNAEEGGGVDPAPLFSPKVVRGGEGETVGEGLGETLTDGEGVLGVGDGERSLERTPRKYPPAADSPASRTPPRTKRRGSARRTIRDSQQTTVALPSFRGKSGEAGAS